MELLCQGLPLPSTTRFIYFKLHKIKLKAEHTLNVNVWKVQKFPTKLSLLDHLLLQGWDQSEQLQQANIGQRRTRFNPWLLQGWHHQQANIEPRRTRFARRRGKRSGKLTMTRIGKRTSSQDSLQGIRFGLFLDSLGDNGKTGILLERTDGPAADEEGRHWVFLKRGRHGSLLARTRTGRSQKKAHRYITEQISD